MKTKMSNKEYHASPALGSTGISLLLERPSKFKAQMIDGIQEDKPCYTFGQAFHTLVLEPDEFDKQFLVTELSGRTNAYKDLVKTNPGKEILKQSDYEQLCSMRDGTMKNKTVRKLFMSITEVESSIFWTDNITKVPCKCRPDAIAEYEGKTVVLDLKSTSDASPDGFAKSVANFGYHRQAAWYSQGIRIETEQVVDLFAFVVVEKSPPFDCGVYYLSAKALTVGLKECRKALDTYKQCKESEEWSGLPDGLTRIDLPTWYR